MMRSVRFSLRAAAAACEPRGSFSDLLEEFYAGRERAERMRRILSGWEGLAEEFGADPRDIAYMAPLFEENL